MTLRATVILLASVVVASSLAAQAPIVPPDVALPPGYGALKQDDIQIGLKTQTLEIRFLPLDPRTGNLLANDAYDAYKRLLLDNRARIDSVARMKGVSRPGVAFVTFFGLVPGAFYDAEVLAIVNRNRLFRPIGIVPYTPGFFEGRLDPRQSSSAFYLYEEAIPVLEPFSIQYQTTFDANWEGKLNRINSERQRVALRAAKAGAMDSAIKPAGQP
jgi:hypothetical protein